MLRVSRAATVFVLLVAVTLPTPQLVAYPSQSSSAVLAGLEAEQMLPDVELTQTPNVIINGTASEEFSWDHWALPDDGIVTLNWTHTPGTVIHIRPQSEYPLPASLDFICFTRSFEWSGGSLPEAGQVTLNMSIVCTGSFNSSEGWRMSRVYVWMIDSSGIWERIYVSRTEDLESFTLKELGLSYFSVLPIFSNPGVITLAIGLSPLSDFMSYNGTEPYQYYSGSVLASFSQLRLDVLIDDEESPSERLEPLFNETYGSSVREVFPDVPEEYANASDRFVEMATDDQGMIYALVNSESDYYHRLEIGHYFAWETILKYDPQLNLLGTTRNANLTHGYDIEVAGGYIYTTGTVSGASGGYDAYVTKWTLAGEKVWDAIWGSDDRESGRAVAVAANGSVYVSIFGYSYQTWEQYSALLKFDGNGEFLWNQSYRQLGFGAEDMAMVDGSLILFEEYSVGRVAWLDSSIVVEDLATAWIFAVDDGGSIYTCYATNEPAMPSWGLVTGRACVFEKMEPSGSRLWNCTFSIIYSNIWYEVLVPISLTPLRDGSLLALIGVMHTGEYYMVLIRADGEYQWERLIFRSHDYLLVVGDKILYYYLDTEMVLCSASTGLVYLGVTVDSSSIGAPDSLMLAYGFALPQSDLAPVIVAVASGANVLIVVAALWYLRKHQRSPSLPAVA